MKGVSVIICCYNSVPRLEQTLIHLAQQEIQPDLQWEVLIVDNASTDNSAYFATSTWANLEAKANADFRIVTEELPGLSHARQKGISEAKFDYLLFCDDDNWLSPSYVNNSYLVMSNNSQIGALGGFGEAVFEVQPPKGIIDYAGTFATGPQAEASGEVTLSKHVYGAGCTYRKSALQELFSKGFNYYLTGRKGTLLLAGDDHELCYALWLMGYKIWYDERLRFKHFIPKTRSTYDYVKKNIIGFAHSGFVLGIYKLIIINRISPRSRFKNSWVYVTLQKILFAGRKIFTTVLNNKRGPLSRTEIHSELVSIWILITNRKQFISIHNAITHSDWINSSANKLSS